MRVDRLGIQNADIRHMQFIGRDRDRLIRVFSRKNDRLIQRLIKDNPDLLGIGREVGPAEQSKPQQVKQDKDARHKP